MSSRYLMFVVTTALIGGLAACESPRPVASRPANVQSAGSVDHQQREIEGRLEAAFRSGRITQEQHRALKSQADDIRRDERRYMANGDMSPSEKQTLLSRLENLSRDLDRLSSR
jgi:hypothetical protein